MSKHKAKQKLNKINKIKSSYFTVQLIKKLETSIFFTNDYECI